MEEPKPQTIEQAAESHGEYIKRTVKYFTPMLNDGRFKCSLVITRQEIDKLSFIFSLKENYPDLKIFDNAAQLKGSNAFMMRLKKETIVIDFDSIISPFTKNKKKLEQLEFLISQIINECTNLEFNAILIKQDLGTREIPKWIIRKFNFIFNL